MPNALITGINGQDGAYLAHLLIGRGYNVWGAMRYESWNAATPSAALSALGVADQISLLPVDFESVPSLACAISAAQPDEIYNLAAQSSVAESFKEPTQTGEVTALGVARLLEAIRSIKPDARFYQAGSSEMFGIARETPQTETTPFYPRSPYGVAKLYAHWMTVNSREAYDVFACNGILFNHESPLRPEKFVTRKICAGVARIKAGLENELVLGNLDVSRDWGFAGDYVAAMWAMMQATSPDDYIVATGEVQTLRNFVEGAFAYVDLDWQDYVRIDPAFFRPTEVNVVVGDPTKAREKLGWQPSMNFAGLVEFLMEAEMHRVSGRLDQIRYYPS